MPVDTSGIVLIAPILAFLIVFVVVYAILFKTKLIGENNWVLAFVSFAVASLFVSVAGTREYVLTIIPWFAALVVSSFLLLALLGFVGVKADSSLYKGAGVVFAVILGIIFLVSGFVVFSDVIVNYLPGPGYGGADSDQNVIVVLNQLYSSRIFGAIILLGLSALVSWVLIKSK